MCCKSFWKKLVPFALALTLGILAAVVFQKIGARSESKVISCHFPGVASERAEGSSGHVIGTGYGVESETEKGMRTATQNVRILSKPRARYTDEARDKLVSGKVRLKVTFLASGQVGDVSLIDGLPSGLTEESIAAAKQIRFEPAKVDGVPQTVSRTVEYSFSIY